MNSHLAHAHDGSTHTHGTGIQLETEAGAILQRGYSELLKMTEGLDFRPLTSERYPLPLSAAIYGETPNPDTVRANVASAIHADPVDGLEAALVLLELYASNHPDADRAIPDDTTFLGLAFGSKRLNGWISVLGDEDPERLESEINARWKFRFISGGERPTNIYTLLNMLARYGFVYGRIPFGDSHTLGHFIEDFTPGLLLCCGRMDDLEHTLSLAAMKLGVPAIVPPDYPFPLGRHVRADSTDAIHRAFPVFSNIRRLLDLPEIPRLPDYLDPEHAREKFEPAITWGNTPESFYILRKGKVDSPGVQITGRPEAALGIVLTAEAEPMDAFDRQYIENKAAQALSMIRGVSAKITEGRLIVELAAGAAPRPERIGEALLAMVRYEFPKIQKIRAEITFDAEKLKSEAPGIQKEKDERLREIESTTEESLTEFITCVGCSPFAPDHVCVLTPERPPQCGRAYEQIKTGALYGFDDMTNIHHRALHSGINSFGTAAKREAIDPVAGEWAGLNEAVWRLTGGRTRRVQLHSLDEAPHTGCGCFKLIIFKTDAPRTGIGIMERGYKSPSPDGRTWADLHYALAGKQTPGVVGAAPGYLTSPKFLAAHNGWENVVWVSPKIAEIAGDRLPEGVIVGTGE